MRNYYFAFFAFFVIFTHPATPATYHKKIAMNYFAAQLTDELDEDGRPRGVLAKEFGINASNLSQFCNGTEVCGEKQRDRILAKMPKDAASRLTAAWLRDRIPDIVEPGSVVVSVDPSRIAEKDVEEFPDVDPELRRMLVYLMTRASRHPEIRSAILSFGQALQGPGTRS